VRMKIRTNKIILERDHMGTITVSVYGSKQTDVEYTSVDGMPHVDNIYQSETTLYPSLSSYHEKEFFKRIADAVDSKDDEKQS
jgi:hypothetical protein